MYDGLVVGIMLSYVVDETREFGGKIPPPLDKHSQWARGLIIGKSLKIYWENNHCTLHHALVWIQIGRDYKPAC